MFPVNSMRCPVMMLTVGLWLAAMIMPVSGDENERESGAPGVIRQEFLESRGFVEWHPARSVLSVSAIEVPVIEFLTRLQSVTGWEILAQSGMEGTITTTVENLPAVQAIRKIAWNAGCSLEHGGPDGIKIRIYRDSVSKATNRILGEPVLPVIPDYTIEKIGDELIVRVREGADVDIEKLARSLGATVLGSIPELNAYRLKFESDEAAEAAKRSLESNSGIASVDSNYRISRPELPSGQVRIPGQSIKVKSAPGADDDTVVIALIDTQINNQANGDLYSDFLLPTLNISGSSRGESGGGSANANGKNAGLTHGDSMFQTLIQGLGITATPENQTFDVKVLPVDVYGNAQETNTFLVASGAARAIENGADIVNLSLGGDQPSSILADVISYGSSQGILFIAAAGNEPVTSPTYPAAYPEVLAVTSVTSNGEIASFANRGEFVDVAAPPTAVVQHEGHSFIASGTSVSTAYISGITAGLASQSGQPVKDIEKSIRQDFKP